MSGASQSEWTVVLINLADGKKAGATFLSLSWHLVLSPNLPIWEEKRVYFQEKVKFLFRIDITNSVSSKKCCHVNKGGADVFNIPTYRSNVSLERSGHSTKPSILQIVASSVNGSKWNRWVAVLGFVNTHFSHQFDCLDLFAHTYKILIQKSFKEKHITDKLGCQSPKGKPKPAPDLSATDWEDILSASSSGTPSSIKPFLIFLKSLFLAAIALDLNRETISRKILCHKDFNSLLMSDFSGLVVVPGHPNGLIFPPKLIFGGLNDFSELVCLFGKE